MYDRDVVARRIGLVEAEWNVRFHPYSVEESREYARQITASAYDEKGVQVRAFTDAERGFIWNERVLSRCDFKYFAERYCWIIPDDVDGLPKPVTLLPAQHLFVDRLAATEREVYRLYDSGATRFPGQKYFVHKARQMGLSTFVQMLGAHRTNFYQMSALVGSYDEQKTFDMYRDHLLYIWDHMPPWMRSPTKSKDRSRGMEFVHGALVSLQDAKQHAGFGQGAKWHFAHVSEVASFEDPVTQLENHFFPSISRGLYGMAFLESTSQGLKDYWHTNTELARAGRKEDWQYFFVPWYLIREFYHDYPPTGWQPMRETQEEAELIYRTSPEFSGGVNVRIDREQMYWWERKYLSYRATNTLNEFYKNYPSTPEQSFVHSGRSSFNIETISTLYRMNAKPVAYELATRSTPSELVITSSQTVTLPDGGTKTIPPPKSFNVDGYDLVPIRVTETEVADPRGLVLLWEEPSDRHDYYLGIDPTWGIESWSRYFRKENDEDIDNGVIQILRRGYGAMPDVQVGEFAAPIQPRPIALVANVLGKLFRGRSEEKQSLVTIEVKPGPGMDVQNEMLIQFNYTNFYQRHKSTDGVNVVFTGEFGWVTTTQSIRELWTLGKHHIGNLNVLTQSRWLVEEMSYCQDDDIRSYLTRGLTRGKAEGGKKGDKRHDDRVYAMLFGLEGARKWSLQIVVPPNPLDMQTVLVAGSPMRVPLRERDLTGDEYRDQIAQWEASLEM